MLTKDVLTGLMRKVNLYGMRSYLVTYVLGGPKYFEKDMEKAFEVFTPDKHSFLARIQKISSGGGEGVGWRGSLRVFFF